MGCAWGTSHVALVSACYGAACALSSPVSGWLIKLIGRIPIISFSAVVHVAAQILMLHWKPSADNPDLFFVLAALWGTTVGILFSQVKGIYANNIFFLYVCVFACVRDLHGPESRTRRPFFFRSRALHFSADTEQTFSFFSGLNFILTYPSPC